MANNKLIEELFNAKAHLGHKTNRIHPKSKKYIYSIENSVSIIDLNKTVDFLEKAEKFINQLKQNNKKLLVVVTKKIASNKIQETCQKNNISYVTTKWPAGLITNFETIYKNVKKLIQMKKDKEEGAWQKFVKHDRVKMEKEILKLEKNYGGLLSLEKLPDALFIVDLKKEKNALNEALNMKIPVVAIVDTNVDPDTIDYPIPANDDSLSSIEYITNKIIKSYTKVKVE